MCFWRLMIINLGIMSLLGLAGCQSPVLKNIKIFNENQHIAATAHEGLLIPSGLNATKISDTYAIPPVEGVETSPPSLVPPGLMEELDQRRR